jgi:hypothetical protein
MTRGGPIFGWYQIILHPFLSRTTYEEAQLILGYLNSYFRFFFLRLCTEQGVYPELVQAPIRNLISEIRFLKVLILVVLAVANWVQALFDAKLA